MKLWVQGKIGVKDRNPSHRHLGCEWQHEKHPLNWQPRTNLIRSEIPCHQRPNGFALKKSNLEAKPKRLCVWNQGSELLDLSLELLRAFRRYWRQVYRLDSGPKLQLQKQHGDALNGLEQFRPNTICPTP